MSCRSSASSTRRRERSSCTSKDGMSNSLDPGHPEPTGLGLATHRHLPLEDDDKPHCQPGPLPLWTSSSSASRRCRSMLLMCRACCRRRA